MLLSADEESGRMLPFGNVLEGSHNRQKGHKNNLKGTKIVIWPPPHRLKQQHTHRNQPSLAINRIHQPHPNNQHTNKRQHPYLAHQLQNKHRMNEA